MSGKNHKMVDGKLLQTNKKYSSLKNSQKERIAQWEYEAIAEYLKDNGKLPTSKNATAQILDKVYQIIVDADIWIPFDEIEKHYNSRKTKLFNRIGNDNKSAFNSSIYDTLMKVANL